MRGWLSSLRRRPYWTALVLGSLVGLGFIGLGVGRRIWAGQHLRAAQAALAHQDPAGARAHLDVCLRVWPDDPTILLLAASAARRDNDLATAQRLLKTCDRLGVPPSSTALERALLRAQNGELGLAEPTLLAALSDDAAQAPLILEVLVPAYINALRLHEAQTWIQRWQRLEPDRAEVYFYKGELDERLRFERDARGNYLQAVRLDPNWLEARLAAARILLEMNEPDVAWEQLSVLNVRRPDDVRVVRLTVRCLRILGRADEALRRLAAMGPLADTDAALLLEWARLDLDAGRTGPAERRLRAAEKLQPTDSQTLLQLARCLDLNGKPDEAQKVRERQSAYERDQMRLLELVKRIGLRPHDPALRCEAGVILFRLHMLDEGRRMLESALAEDPRHAPSHWALAEYFRQQGDSVRANLHRHWAERAGSASIR